MYYLFVMLNREQAWRSAYIAILNVQINLMKTRIRRAVRNESLLFESASIFEIKKNWNQKKFEISPRQTRMRTIIAIENVRRATINMFIQCKMR